jgi:hypothetical protein
MEGEALLDRILENTLSLEPLRVEPELIHEEVSSAEAEPITSIERPSPKPKDLEEGFQPLDFLFFEDDNFEDFRNTSKYKCQRRPPVPVTPSKALDKEFLRDSIKELTARMSSEWSKEVEHSSEEIQIHVPSSTVQCHISRNMVNTIYNPTVGANILSVSFARTFLVNEPIALTNKTFRVGPQTRLEGLNNISVYHDNMEIILDFHVFDI